VARFMARKKPLSVLGLLATVVPLFGFQGRVILAQPPLIALIAAPLPIQSAAIFTIGFGRAWLRRAPFPIAAPCALIATSNLFEPAAAVAIGLFGWTSARRWCPWSACC
jgi:ACR3 family arsenite transporter